MEEDNAFYVVRKGDIVGVYKSFNECQHQLSSSVCDPAVSVYKGYSLSGETEEYLASHGLKNALYSINSRDLKEDLFGTLVPCPIQQPDVKSPSTQKRSKDKDEIRSHQMTDPLTKHLRLSERPKDQPPFCIGASCILEFDGASKGNPGKSGAGAILRSEDGTVVCRLREGLGTATNNVAEYRALILGMKYALKKGFRSIRIQGDSLLVCNQVQDIWQTKNENLVDLHKEAKELKAKFDTFRICAVARVKKKITLPQIFYIIFHRGCTAIMLAEHFMKTILMQTGKQTSPFIFRVVKFMIPVLQRSHYQLYCPSSFMRGPCGRAPKIECRKLEQCQLKDMTDPPRIMSST